MKPPFFLIALVVIFIYLFFVKKGTAQYKIDESKFDSQQLKMLNILHDKAKETFAKFIQEAEAKTGWKIIITSSYRTFSHQQRLKYENAKNADPGRSWHNYGLAIDINLSKGDKRVKKADSRQTWESTGVPQIAAKYGLFWGVNIPNYHDPVHFDISKIIKSKYSLDTADLLQKAKQQFGSEWEDIHGNKLKF